MARTKALVRQWTLLRVLSQHSAGLTIAEMARHTSVNDRTIRRDLKLFVDAGIPLREASGFRSKKVWRVEQRGTMVTVSNSGDEALALILAEKLFESLKGTRFYTALKRCREHLTAALSTPNRVRLEQQSKSIKIDLQRSADILTNTAVIDELWRALEACEPLKNNGRGALIHSLQPAANNSKEPERAV